MSGISPIGYGNIGGFFGPAMGQSRPAFDAAGTVGSPEGESKVVLNPGQDVEKKPGMRSSPAECETCKNRKYQDGSNEMVSFKSAQHISPQAAPSRVRGHEQEHVSNAYNKARNNNGHVERATVRLKTDICPECGRSYISGGETNTQIKYYNEENPYQKDLKQTDAVKYRGANVDIAA
jgi:hypothetical protein